MELTLSPFVRVALTLTSKALFFLSTDEINATMQSSPRETCRISAGLTFCPDRSVNGNGTRTIRPLPITLLEIGCGIQFRLAGKEIKRARIRSNVRDVGERVIVGLREADKHRIKGVAPADSKYFAAIPSSVHYFLDVFAGMRS